MAPDLGSIKAFAFDVDGILTDGGILCDLQGELYRTFDAKDGFAIRMAAMNGYHLAIITGGRSKSILSRARSLLIPDADVFLNSRKKAVDFSIFCSRHNLSPKEVMFFGDDVPDIEVFKCCGIGVCPSDGAADAKEAAHVISAYPGGKGCVRDMLEKVMKYQDRWKFNNNVYSKMY